MTMLLQLAYNRALKTLFHVSYQENDRASRRLYMKPRLKKHLPFILLLLANFTFAIFYGGDFGESWDEQARYAFAQDSIEHYLDLTPKKRIGDKGPVYYVVAKLGGDLIKSVNPDLSPIQAWHFIHFATFLLGLCAFYSLSLRVLNPTTAFFSTALFNTQPLLFGHAWINPKDIPFMAFFLLTIASGLKVSDQLENLPDGGQGDQKLKGLISTFKQDWESLNLSTKVLSLGMMVGSLISLFFVRYYPSYFQIRIKTLINQTSQPALRSFLNRLSFLLFNAGIDNGITLNNVKAIYPFLFIFLLLFITAVLLVLIMCYFPQLFRWLSGYRSRKTFRHQLFRVLRLPQIYFGAFVLGFAATNRTLTLAAGFLVLLYIWINHRTYLLPVSLVYLGTAVLVIYLSWPAMWGNPILGLFRSLFQVSDFSWGGNTLFWGVALGSEQLPATYIPTLLAIQFTLPALLLFGLGLFAVKDVLQHDRETKTLILLMAGWFFLPLASTLIVDPATYDNFRHYFFLVPPLFFIAGLGLSFLVKHIQPSYPAFILAVLFLIPGIWNIITLHPYQYIYYNGLVGGVEGAFREFETDYWATSYRECTRYLNEVAPPHAKIVVTGPAHIVKNYAREDLEILKYRKPDAHWMFDLADYAIISSRGNHDRYLLEDQPTIYEVTRSGATLSVIKEIQKGQ